MFDGIGKAVGLNATGVVFSRLFFVIFIQERAAFGVDFGIVKSTCDIVANSVCHLGINRCQCRVDLRKSQMAFIDADSEEHSSRREMQPAVEKTDIVDIGRKTQPLNLGSAQRSVLATQLVSLSL